MKIPAYVKDATAIFSILMSFAVPLTTLWWFVWFIYSGLPENEWTGVLSALVIVGGVLCTPSTLLLCFILAKLVVAVYGGLEDEDA